MSPTVHAMAKATKSFLRIWLIAGILIFGYLAVDTDFFTKQPSWTSWQPWMSTGTSPVEATSQ